MPHSEYKLFFVTYEIKLCARLFTIQANFVSCLRVFSFCRWSRHIPDIPPSARAARWEGMGNKEITAWSSRWHPTPQKLSCLCGSTINTDYTCACSGHSCTKGLRWLCFTNSFCLPRQDWRNPVVISLCCNSREVVYAWAGWKTKKPQWHFSYSKATAGMDVLGP